MDTNLKSTQATGLKWFFRIISITSIFFTMQLPSVCIRVFIFFCERFNNNLLNLFFFIMLKLQAILYHFFCTNLISFTQTLLLKNNKVRSSFGLPAIVRPNINELVKKKSLMEQWKEWNTAALTENNKNKNKKRK